MPAAFKFVLLGALLVHPTRAGLLEITESFSAGLPIHSPSTPAADTLPQISNEWIAVLSFNKFLAATTLAPVHTKTVTNCTLSLEVFTIFPAVLAESVPVVLERVGGIVGFTTTLNSLGLTGSATVVTPVTINGASDDVVPTAGGMIPVASATHQVDLLCNPDWISAWVDAQTGPSEFQYDLAFAVYYMVPDQPHVTFTPGFSRLAVGYEDTTAPPTVSTSSTAPPTVSTSSTNGHVVRLPLPKSRKHTKTAMTIFAIFGSTTIVVVLIYIVHFVKNRKTSHST